MGCVGLGCVHRGGDGGAAASSKPARLTVTLLRWWWCGRGLDAGLALEPTDSSEPETYCALALDVDDVDAERVRSSNVPSQRLHHQHTTTPSLRAMGLHGAVKVRQLGVRCGSGCGVLACALTLLVVAVECTSAAGHAGVTNSVLPGHCDLYVVVVGGRWW